MIDEKRSNCAASNMCMNVSIVSYRNSPDQLRALRDKLLESQSIRCVIMVDNAGDERLVPLFSGERCAYHVMHKNVGYGHAHNVALRLSCEENVPYHLVLNPDIGVDATTLDSCVERMATDAGVALLMPKVLYPDGRLQRLCRRLPHPGVLLARRVLPYSLRRSMDRRYTLADYTYQKELDVPALSGCFMLLRTKYLKEAGYFDERYFMYMEDYDLTRRLGRYGRTICWPEVSVTHEYRRGSARNIRLLYAHTWSTIQYFFKWGWFWDRERRERNIRTDRQIYCKTGTDRNDT